MLSVFQSTVVHGRRRRRHLLQRQQHRQSPQHPRTLATGSAPFLSASSNHTRRQQSRPPAAARDVSRGESRRRWRHCDVTEFSQRLRKHGARWESGRGDRSAEADRVFGENSTRSTWCFPGCSISSHQRSTTSTQTQQQLLRTLTRLFTLSVHWGGILYALCITLKCFTYSISYTLILVQTMTFKLEPVAQDRFAAWRRSKVRTGIQFKPFQRPSPSI